MEARAPRTSRRIAVAMSAAILAHAAALGLFAWIVLSDRAAVDDDAPAGSAPGSASAPSEAAAPAPAPAPIALLDVDVQPPAHPVPTAHDPGDQAGARAVDRGDGAGSGQAAWTGRHDRADDALLRHEPWNGGDTYRSAHDDTRAPPATTEAIHRAPQPDTGDRQRGPSIAPGAPRASSGDAVGQGAGDSVRAPLAADPVLGAPAGATTPAGAAHPGGDHAASADVGATAEDVPRHGAVGDDRAVAARSDATRTDPYDVTPPSAGGGGAAGEGGGPAVTADADDPYFREFLRRLEATVVYPDDLRRTMRSGRVVASFRLSADGTIGELRVEVHARYTELDRALVTALRQLGTLGPVPRRLLRDGAEIRVRVPFTFSNPMIR